MLCASEAASVRPPSGLRGESTVIEATLQFHALCEGLAALESRGVRIPFDAKRIGKPRGPR